MGIIMGVVICFELYNAGKFIFVFLNLIYVI